MRSPVAPAPDMLDVGSHVNLLCTLCWRVVTATPPCIAACCALRAWAWARREVGRQPSKRHDTPARRIAQRQEQDASSGDQRTGTAGASTAAQEQL